MIDPQRKFVFIGDKLPALRSEAATVRRERFDRLHAEYRRLRSKELSVAPPPESVTYVGIHSMNLALLYLLTGSAEYLAEARRWIRAAVGWEDWGYKFLVNVDLSSSWLLWGLGLSFDWLKDELPADEREALRAKLLRQGRLMFDFKKSTEGTGWSTNYWQNHNWINLNGLATAGYALAADSPASPAAAAAGREGQVWTADARKNFDVVYDVMADDGSDYEGTAYWRYGIVWLLAYAELAREREGIDYFASSAFLRNTFWYRLHQAAPGLRETMNFGDCHETRSSHSAAAYYKFAAEYRIGQARLLGDLTQGFIHQEHYESGIRPGILPEAGLEFLWFDPAVASESLERVETVRFFPDLGLLCARDSWAPDATALSVKCGAPGGAKQWRQGHALERERGWSVLGLSHQHPDNGAFILFSRGSYLACDEGYSRELRLADHNAVLVDGKGYRDEGQNNIWKATKEGDAARLEYCDADGAFVAFSGDSARCYDDSLGVARARRTILGGEGGYWVVLDELAAELPRTFSWRLHAETAARDAAAPEGAAVPGYRWTNGAASLDLRRILPAEAETEFSTTVVKSIMTPQEPDKFRVSLLRTLDERTAPSRSARFLHVLAAGSAFEPCPVEVRPLPSEAGTAFAVSGPFGEHRWLVAGPEGRAAADGAETDADWLFLGARRRSRGGAYLVLNGKKTALNGGFDVE
jgi:hypothetical protein